MKKSILVLVASLMLIPCNAIAEDDFNGVKAGDAVIFNGGQPHRLIECEPEGWYCYETHMLTIEFPSVGFEPYTITLASTLVEMDYYVTTPFVSLNVAELVGYTVNINMETDGGDLYWGSFDATSGSSTE